MFISLACSYNVRSMLLLKGFFQFTMEVFDLFAQSTDFNPNPNMWGELKHRLSDQTKTLVAEWEQISAVNFSTSYGKTSPQDWRL